VLLDQFLQALGEGAEVDIILLEVVRADSVLDGLQLLVQPLLVLFDLLQLVGEGSFLLQHLFQVLVLFKGLLVLKVDCLEGNLLVEVIR